VAQWKKSEGVNVESENRPVRTLKLYDVEGPTLGTTIRRRRSSQRHGRRHDGSTQYADLPIPGKHPALTAVKILQDYLGEPFSAIVSGELDVASTAEAFCRAVLFGAAGPRCRSGGPWCTRAATLAVHRARRTHHTASRDEPAPRRHPDHARSQRLAR
jgi:hypothetical protein